jgi:anti-anti-sigma regulatory factor
MGAQMNISGRGHFVFENLTPDVIVARFTSRDAGKELYDVEPVTESDLFQDLEQGVLSTLKKGQSLILNFGWVETFGSPFYRFLLNVRELTLHREGRLILCRLSPLIYEAFDILRGQRIFEIVNTEEEALRTMKS